MIEAVRQLFELLVRGPKRLSYSSILQVLLRKGPLVLPSCQL
jgi:hypothetical protein